MKLYSHTQLIRTTFICVLAAVLLTAAICINISKKKSGAGAVTAEASVGDVAEVQTRRKLPRSLHFPQVPVQLSSPSLSRILPI